MQGGSDVDASPLDDSASIDDGVHPNDDAATDGAPRDGTSGDSTVDAPAADSRPADSTVVDSSVDLGPSCPPPKSPCGSACFDLSSDGFDCGSCGNVCPGVVYQASQCVGGTCKCPPANQVCGGGVNLALDTSNCGTCGHDCYARGSAAYCSQGQCVCTEPGAGLCGGVCTSLRADTKNCGSCGHVCPGGTFCNNGSCS